MGGGASIARRHRSPPRTSPSHASLHASLQPFLPCLPAAQVFISAESIAFSGSAFTACVHAVAANEADMCWGNYLATAQRMRLSPFSGPLYVRARASCIPSRPLSPLPRGLACPSARSASASPRASPSLRRRGVHAAPQDNWPQLTTWPLSKLIACSDERKRQEGYVWHPARRTGHVEWSEGAISIAHYAPTPCACMHARVVGFSKVVSN